jgi:outer membrane receptor protein involved in Fe transport
MHEHDELKKKGISMSKRSMRRRHLHVGRVTSIGAAVLTALYGTPARADDSLQEITVTATRRAASAQDIPISITAVSGAALDEAGIEDIASLAHSMAGVNYTDKGPFSGVNGSTLIIRGLNSEATGGHLGLATSVVPPVATYVDDTPLFVNLRLDDLDRVEILRGPQGTLYGSGSLGGTIRFVQNAPDPKAFDAKVEAGLSDTEHTHALNEEIKGMLNLPITDTFAVRLNASSTNEAGFIDQPNLYVLNAAGIPVAGANGAPETTAVQGVNSYQYRTARIAALWKPSEELRAQLTYYYQEEGAGGFPYVATNPNAYNKWINPGGQPVPPFCLNTYAAPGCSAANPADPTPLVPSLYTSGLPAGINGLSSATNSLEGTTDRADVLALSVDYDVGFATLTSASSWAHHTNHTQEDLTALYTNFSFYQNLYGQNPRSFIQGHDLLDDKLWSQELRLASKAGDLFDWVGGAFFKNQTTDIQEHEFYPGYQEFFNACSPGATVANGGIGDTLGYNPSRCGVGETGQGVYSTYEGIPLNLDQAYIGDFETQFKDLAAFGELTWHITSDWGLTGGTRVFKQTVSQAQQTGLLFDAGPVFGPYGSPLVPIANTSLSDEWRKALWKVNTSYRLDKNNLVYATWSQGFRRGGVNALPGSEPGLGYTTPPGLSKVEPDKADNYEIGVKGTVFNRMRYSAAIFDIQWHNLQEGVALTPLVLPAAINVGDAYSRGFETEILTALTDHIGAQVEYTYDVTKITSYNALFVYPNISVPPPPVGGVLPGTPKTSLAVSLDYAHLELAGGELQYVIGGHYQSAVLPAISSTIPTVAGYTMLDTRLVFTRANWRGTLYVDNLTNNLGITSYQDPGNYGYRAQALVSTPRTYGIKIGYSFKEW